MQDIRLAQTIVENAIRDAILFALGKRFPSVATAAAVRALPSRGTSGGTIRDDDDLICIASGGVVSASYRWSTPSTSADDGTNVLRPDDVLVGEPGRWLKWTSPLRFEPVVGGNSYALHAIETGILEKVVILDQDMSVEDIERIIEGHTPSVVISASGDDPERLNLHGFAFDTTYRFKITAIAQNLRDRREHAQGSTVDVSVGANTIDGMIKALLHGTQLGEVVDGVRMVTYGRGENWRSEFIQRRVFRTRDWDVALTEWHPPAPNDAGPVQGLTMQGELADLGEHDAIDEGNYVTLGIRTSTGVGLTKTISAGTAKIAGATVNYAGQLKTFTASRDTYRDLLPAGTLVFLEVPVGDPAPAVTATALRIGFTRTDADSVVADTMIAASAVPYTNPYTIV